MRTNVLAAIFSLAILWPSFHAHAAPAVTADWTCYRSKTDFFAAEIRRNAVKLNNFIVAERPNILGEARTWPMLAIETSFSYSVSNLGPKKVYTDVQFAAFDERNRLMYTIYANSPSFGVPPGGAVVATNRLPLEKSSLARARQFCILVRSFEADPTPR
jgi:hypothetical protein